MTLDQLIGHLQSLRESHGGSIEVMLGQSHPDNDKLWSGVKVTPEMIRESVAEASFTSVPGYGHKTGWIWFQVPADGIKHRQLPQRR
jgi:hypothetical protein